MSPSTSDEQLLTRSFVKTNNINSQINEQNNSFSHVSHNNNYPTPG